MELERRDIERRDFPQAKKGYDSAEVDRHLRAVAEAVEQLKASQPQQATLAGTAASRVEAIVAAAESSAREIEERARAEAADHVKRAEETVDRLLARAQELQAEMGEIVDRVGGLKSAIDSIRSDFDAAAPAPAAPPAPVAAPAPEPEPEPAPEPEPEPQPEPAPEPQPKAAPQASEGARLIALNMALGGSPREETARYLRDNYELEDPDALLDDVYARVGS